VKRIILAAALALVAALPARAAEGIVTYKSIAPDVAFDLARTALNQCRKDGYQVAVVVVDRFGLPLVILRDQFAGSMALQVASNKAKTANAFATSSGDLGKRIQAGELSPDYKSLPDVVTLGGGIVIEAGGAKLGAVGVSGGPGGDKDEACAKAGLAAVQDKLDF
jgi:uncharacterized protein GlcG (DUF336 family)